MIYDWVGAPFFGRSENQFVDGRPENITHKLLHWITTGLLVSKEKVCKTFSVFLLRESSKAFVSISSQDSNYR